MVNFCSMVFLENNSILVDYRVHATHETIIKRESRTPRNQRLSVYRFKFPRSRFHTISPVRLTILEHPRLFRLIATLSPPLSILRQARNHKEHIWLAPFFASLLISRLSPRIPDSHVKTNRVISVKLSRNPAKREFREFPSNM